MQIFQRTGVFEQDPQFSRPSGTHHDRNRCRQPQRAGTTDDQHRDHGFDCRRRISGQEHPTGKREKGDPDDHRHKNGTDPVRQTGDRRFAVCRFLYQINDPGKGRFFADFFRPEPEKTHGADRSGKDVHPRDLIHRHTFPGQCRLIQRCRTGDHHPIHRHGIAAADDYNISRLDFGKGDQPFRTRFILHRGAFRTQFQQLCNGIARAPAADRFQIFSQSHDRQDHARTFKVESPFQILTREQDLHHAVKTVRDPRGSAGGDQRFHIRHAFEQVLETPCITGPVKVQDRQKQQQLQQRVGEGIGLQHRRKGQMQHRTHGEPGKGQQKEQRDDETLFQCRPFPEIFLRRIE